MNTNEDIIAMLCRRVKLARIEKNWSQIELAEHANLGIATIKRVEMGDSITLLTLISILRGLGELDQLKNILVHKEPKLNVKRSKLQQRKRRLLTKPTELKTTSQALIEDEYGFILADDSPTMRWQKQ